MNEEDDDDDVSAGVFDNEGCCVWDVDVVSILLCCHDCVALCLVYVAVAEGPIACDEGELVTKMFYPRPNLISINLFLLLYVWHTE